MHVDQTPSIAFITLGCAKNEVDTDKMQALLEQAGFSITDDCSQADLVIVNTCAFLSSAVEEGLEVIFDLSQNAPDAKPNRKILVVGCMPSRYGSSLEEELLEAHAFVPAADEGAIVTKVNKLLGTSRYDDASCACSQNQLRHAYPTTAYVKISDGCDRFCSYCMIPYIRGRYHSYSYDEIFAEVEELTAHGVKEIVLIGQDTGLWGADLDDGSSTANLLDRLSSAFHDTWFRLLYIQPEGITDELLNVVSQHGNICPYFDIPLQHSDSAIIENMNRTGSASAYLQLIQHIRDRVPNVTLRTTFLVGFPGETQEQFDGLLDFIEEAQFDYAAVFPFSPEEGSAASSMPKQIEEDVRFERAQTVYDVCENISVKRAAQHIGRIYRVLVEDHENTDVGPEALCRYQGQAPEIDGQVHVPLSNDDELPVGSFADVLITNSFFYELEGELI